MADKTVKTLRGGAKIESDDPLLLLKSEVMDEFLADNPEAMLGRDSGREMARHFLRKGGGIGKQITLEDFMRIKPKGMSLDDFARLYFDRKDKSQYEWQNLRRQLGEPWE